MPDISGYEVCSKLRSQSQTKFVSIIFVTSLDTTDERLKGFELGADDYIVKPVNKDILIEKVTHCLHNKKETVAAKISTNEAMSVAMEAMTVSSELGQIIEFIKTLQSISSAEEVGQKMIDIINQFGVQSAVCVKTNIEFFIGCEDQSIEAIVLQRFTHHSERILSVGMHTIIRNEHIIMLLKNMPLNDENLYGRLKDHLAVLMDIANGHLVSINAHAQMLSQKKEFLEKVIGVAEQQIQLTRNRIHQHFEGSHKIMQGMLFELEGMLFGLGLEDDQEKKLIELGDKASSKLEAAESTTEQLSADLGIILEHLYELLKIEK